MVPHPSDETPLRLVVTLIPMAWAMVIFLYIFIRISFEFRRRHKLKPRHVDPERFITRPDVQERVDALYLTRRKLRDHVNTHKHYTVRNLEEILVCVDDVIHTHIDHASTLVDASKVKPAKSHLEQSHALLSKLMDEIDASPDHALTMEHIRHTLALL